MSLLGTVGALCAPYFRPWNRKRATSLPGSVCALLRLGLASAQSVAATANVQKGRRATGAASRRHAHSFYADAGRTEMRTFAPESLMNGRRLKS